MRPSSAFPILLLVCAAGGFTTTAPAQQRVDRSVSAAPTGEVEIVNTAGSVRVVGVNASQVRVTGTLGRGTERLDVDRSGGRTTIRVVIPRNARDVRGSDLEVRVPAGSRVAVRTVSADIRVDRVDGAVEARSVSGDVTAGGSPRELDLSSTSGDIDVSAATGRLGVQTTSGDVHLRGRAREVEATSVSGDVTVQLPVREVRAKSVSGDVTLRGVADEVAVSTVSGDVLLSGGDFDRVEAKSTSGALRLEGALRRGAQVEMTSHSGTVQVRVPAGVSADWDVRTFSGNVLNAWGQAAARTSRRGPGRELHFTSGGGGARITLRTFSGDVRLVKR